ncbi:hypothetical protein AB0362_25340 [Rhodococcus sp. NPDC079359]|uniref:hypothetical protein n=1 Tax=Rhodococcus sp. NPDC079359 TaxID=3154961 RepID=UPI00344C0DB2
MSEPATPSTGDDWLETELPRVKDEHVHDPRDDWYTEDDLVENGYRREALVDLFGHPIPGHDGVPGWTVSSVAKIELTQLAPAYELLRSAFGTFDDEADTMTSRVFHYFN